MLQYLLNIPYEKCENINLQDTKNMKKEIVPCKRIAASNKIYDSEDTVTRQAKGA